MSNHSVLHTDGTPAGVRRSNALEHLLAITAPKSEAMVGSPSSSTYGPPYYRRGSIQVWDFIRDQELNFHLGNAIKYICRAGHKHSAISDLKKAIHYLTNELESYQPTPVNSGNSGPRISKEFPSTQFSRRTYEDYAERLDC
jgi:hypothetical protein